MSRIAFDDWPGVIAGCLLGDGSRSGNAVVAKHTNPQKSYVLAKYRLFKQMGLRVSRRLDFVSNTTFGPRLYSQVKVWCPDKRLFPLSALDCIDQLNPVGLLIWWLDDGSLTVSEKNNGRGSVARFGYLHTQRFTREENEAIAARLLDQWGFRLRVHKDRGGLLGPDVVYYRLYFNATALRLLIDIVRPYLWLVPRDMRYKLHMDYRPTKLSTSAEYIKRYNIQKA